MTISENAGEWQTTHDSASWTQIVREGMNGNPVTCAAPAVVP